MIEHGIQHGHTAKVSTARQHLAVMHGHARSCTVMLARATAKVLCPCADDAYRLVKHTSGGHEEFIVYRRFTTRFYREPSRDPQLGTWILSVAGRGLGVVATLCYFDGKGSCFILVAGFAQPAISKSWLRLVSSPSVRD